MEEKKLDKIKSDLAQECISAVKCAVRLTLEEIKKLEKQRGEIQDKIRILKHDLYDMKDGRLDRVLERQLLNDSIKELSIISVEKIPEVNGAAVKSVWYIDYSLSVKTESGVITVKINNSTTKLHASGAYKLSDGDILYL